MSRYFFLPLGLFMHLFFKGQLGRDRVGVREWEWRLTRREGATGWNRSLGGCSDYALPSETLTALCI